MSNQNQTIQVMSMHRLMTLCIFIWALVACAGGSTTDPGVQSLGLREPVTITFDESMDTASLQLGGTLANESDGGVWSTTRVPNDTLTISPSTGSWTGGATRTLVVNVRNALGGTVPTISNTYLIDPLVLTNFQAAEVVIGQPDFTSGDPNQGGAAGANTIKGPYGNPLVAPNGTLFIGDSENHRILAYAQVPTASNASASFVLGQPDFTSTAYSISRSAYPAPEQIVTYNGKMIVNDYDAHRILIYNAIPTDGSALPDVVVGQPDFTSNGSACDAHSLNGPEAVTVTPDGKLLVTDRGHYRVLIWNSIPTTNGQAADVVIGQSDFTHCTQNDDDQNGVADAAPTTRTLNDVSGIWTDGARLAVTDTHNNRVLIWNSVPTTNFQPADLVLGQATFTRNTFNDDDQNGTADATASARTMFSPYLGIHSNGTQLAVADSNNNRILIWNTELPPEFRLPEVT